MVSAGTFFAEFAKEGDGVFKPIITGDQNLGFLQKCLVKTVVNTMTTLIVSESKED